MATNSARFESKNDRAGEDQQQFIRPTWTSCFNSMLVSDTCVGHLQTSVVSKACFTLTLWAPCLSSCRCSWCRMSARTNTHIDGLVISSWQATVIIGLGTDNQTRQLLIVYTFERMVHSLHQRYSEHWALWDVCLVHDFSIVGSISVFRLSADITLRDL
jgi:hypothetical protein